MKTPEELTNDNNPVESRKISPDEKLLSRRDLIRIGLIALILSISLILPGYLFIAGLKLGWAIALFVGFLVVAWLGYRIKR